MQSASSVLAAIRIRYGLSLRSRGAGPVSSVDRSWCDGCSRSRSRPARQNVTALTAIAIRNGVVPPSASSTPAARRAQCEPTGLHHPAQPEPPVTVALVRDIGQQTEDRRPEDPLARRRHQCAEKQQPERPYRRRSRRRQAPARTAHPPRGCEVPIRSITSPTTAGTAMENSVATVSSTPAVPSGMSATRTKYRSNSGPAQPPPNESIAKPARSGRRPRTLGRPREVVEGMLHPLAHQRRTAQTCRSGRQATAVISTMATNATPNGAARPNRCASTPPSAEPIAAPPTDASR